MPERFRLQWSSSATQDLDGILEYIAMRDSVNSALLVYENIISRIESLTRFPRRCRIVPELKEIGVTVFRELIVSRYRICFRIDGKKVVLVGVLDSRRDLEEILIDRACRYDPDGDTRQ